MRAIIFLVLALPGCAATPQGQDHVLSDEMHLTESGKKRSVNDLKSDYLKQTGQNLVVIGALDCGWDGDCYYNKYAEAYDSGMSRFKEKQRRQQQLERDKCNASPECSRSVETAEYQNSLRNAYSYTLGSHPYQQGEYDMAVRSMCDKADTAQKNGMRLNLLINQLRDIPGLSPMDREQMISVASDCWNLSRLGSDWKESLRSSY